MEFQFQRQSFQRIFRTDYSWNQRGGPKSADLERISASFTDLRLGLGQRDRYKEKKESEERDWKGALSLQQGITGGGGGGQAARVNTAGRGSRGLAPRSEQSRESYPLSRQKASLSTSPQKGTRTPGPRLSGGWAFGNREAGQAPWWEAWDFGGFLGGEWAGRSRSWWAVVVGGGIGAGWATMGMWVSCGGGRQATVFPCTGL